jgi:hypothetical protein
MKDGMGGILSTHERNQKRIYYFDPSNAELNPICHLLVLLGAHHIFHMKTKTDQHATYNTLKSVPPFHDSSRQQYGTYIKNYSMKLIAFSA